jgi:hypothetical protein
VSVQLAVDGHTALGLALITGQVTGFALAWLHGRLFHRPGTAHRLWWQARPWWVRRPADLLAACWLAAGLVLLTTGAGLPAAVLIWAGDLAYGTVMIIRRRSACPVSEEDTDAHPG